jgi:hypothetical protein
MFQSVLKKMSAATLLLLGCQALLLFAMQIVSQRLGKSGYGRFGLAMSISVFASQFIQWGMDQVLTVKFARGSIDESRRLFGVLLRQKQVAALLALSVGAIVALSWRESEERLLIFLGAADGVCLAFTIPSIFDARGKTPTWQCFAFVRHSIYLATLLTIGAFFPVRFTPTLVVAIHLMCVLPEVLLEQLWIHRNYGAPHWPAPASEAFALWRAAAPMALAVLAQQVLFNSGLPIMRALAPNVETGGLYLSNQFTTAAASFIGAPAAILHARLALHAHEGAAFRARVWKTALPCAAAGLVVSLAYPVVTSWIVHHFFKSLADSTPAILVVDTWRLAPILTTIPLSSALICQGNLRGFAACHVVAALIGMAVSVALVPTYGPRATAGGIAVGSCACLIFVATLVLFDRREAIVEHAL